MPGERLRTRDRRDRARRVGSEARAHEVVFRPHTHPLHPPAGGYGARFAGVGPPLARGGWVVPPGIPTQYTLPARTMVPAGMHHPED